MVAQDRWLLDSRHCVSTRRGEGGDYAGSRKVGGEPGWGEQGDGTYYKFALPDLKQVPMLFSIVCNSTYATHLTGFFFFGFLGPHLPRHMEVPRLGVKSVLQLPAYTTATARPDPSHVCDLHHSSRQCQIPNPPSEARDQT